MQRNSNGEVALKYLRGGQRLVGEYVFIPRANISLAWVKEQDINKLFAVRRGCCGNTKRVIFPANEQDVRIWNNNGGR